jgi:hypothetical protein
VKEMISENPKTIEKKSSPKIIERVFDAQLKPSLDRLSNANLEDVLGVAASQIEVMDIYYKEVLSQARKSFYSAWFATVLGLLVLLSSILFYQFSKNQNITVLSLISAALIEFIAGVNFYLQGKTSGQLSEFHRRLEWTQRYLMANSICEKLQGEYRQRARLELVRSIFGLEGSLTLEPKQPKEEGDQETQ